MRAVLLATAALVAMPGVAQAKTPRTDCGEKKLLVKYSAQYHAVQDEQGKRAPGRNIRRYGLSKTKKSQCRHIAKSLRILRAKRHPGTSLMVQGKPYQPPASIPTNRAGGTLAAIRSCESGGNYSTNTGNGFYGAYQFTQSTWQSVGGSGNPANASPAEQDKRAAILYAREGAAPWPVCGR
jgi:hypothetical protein